DMPIDQENALTWLPRRLAKDRTGSATIVWESMLRRYLKAEQNAELDSVIAQAGAAATAQVPLIYAKYEIIDGAEALTVRMYTGSDTREFALPTQLPNRSPGIDIGGFFTAAGLLPAEDDGRGDMRSEEPSTKLHTSPASAVAERRLAY